MPGKNRRLLMSARYFARDPREVIAAAARHVEHDELGKLVRMKLDKTCLQRWQRVACGLDDQLPFDAALKSPLPVVERSHRREDVHAGCEFFLDERPRQRLGRLVIGPCRKYKYDFTHELYF